MLAIPAATAGRLRFPLLASPKLDGMRVCITARGPVTRSLRPLPNEKIRTYLDRDALRGLDGELIWGDPVAREVVQRSIGAGMTKRGPAPERGLSYWVFDDFSEPDAPFKERHAMAAAKVKQSRLELVHLVPQFEVTNAAELEFAEEQILSLGFEGVMLRRPDGPYVVGRVKPRSQILMKLKRREQMSGEIVGVVRRRSDLAALMVRHPDWRHPFEVPVRSVDAKQLEKAELVGRKVVFSRQRGSWEGAPRSPLFVEMANQRPVRALRLKTEDQMPRELIDTGKDKRYVRRNKSGQFKESDDVGRSLTADRRTKAKTTAVKGQGDRGDRKRVKTAKKRK